MRTRYTEITYTPFWDENWIGEKPRSLARIKKDRVFKVLKRYLPPAPPPDYRIIDAGSGLGEQVAYLSELGFDVVGIDNSPVALEKVKNTWGNKYHFEFGNILNLGQYPDGSFDFYLSLGVLEHFEQGLKEPLDEAWRLLKAGGTIAFSVPYINLLRRKFNSPLEDPTGKDFYYYLFDLKELTETITQSRFRVLEFIPLAMPWAFLGDFPVLHKIPFAMLLCRILAKTGGRLFPWFIAHMVLAIAKRREEDRGADQEIDEKFSSESIQRGRADGLYEF